MGELSFQLYFKLKMRLNSPHKNETTISLMSGTIYC